jgi:TolA-binding protein
VDRFYEIKNYFGKINQFNRYIKKTRIMTLKNEPNTLELLLQSLEDDFDKHERQLIFLELKNSNPTDDALLGAKLILEQNNWDYLILKKAFAKAETRIDTLASQKTTQNSKIKYLKYAAVLIPIALIMGYFTNNVNNSIDQFYTKETGLPNLMNGKKTNFDDLMQLYTSNHLEKAFALSAQIKAEKPSNDTINYFEAIIAYDLKNYAVAKQGFKKVALNKRSPFYKDAEFRLGFVLNQLNKVEEAKNQFEKVKTNNDNPYCEEAEKVLEVLETSKNWGFNL